MQFIKRKVRSEKELFLDLIYILDKCEDEERINYSILMFFENGKEIIKSKKQKEAYKDVIDFISNNEFLKIYGDENLSVLEKTKRIIYMN